MFQGQPTCCEKKDSSGGTPSSKKLNKMDWLLRKGRFSAASIHHTEQFVTDNERIMNFQVFTQFYSWIWIWTLAFISTVQLKLWVYDDGPVLLEAEPLPQP